MPGDGGGDEWASRSRSSTTSRSTTAPPHLVAWEAVDSGALYFDRRNADAKSGGTEFKRRKLGDHRQGAVVHDRAPRRSRACPCRTSRCSSTSTAAASVKANLLNVPPDPEHVKLGMAVKMTTFVAGTDDDGTEAIAFAFEPAEVRRER